jgi:hypothetical protein
MSQTMVQSAHVSSYDGRARAARIGAGVAVLAMALVVYGTYGDSQASSSQKSALPFLLIIDAVIAAIVYGLLAPIADRAVSTGAPVARRWAVGFTVASVVSLAVFWSGLPLLLGGATALVGHSGRSVAPGSRTFGAAWWLGWVAAAVAVVVTVLGNTVAGH